MYLAKYLVLGPPSSVGSINGQGGAQLSWLSTYILSMRLGSDRKLSQ